VDWTAACYDVTSALGIEIFLAFKINILLVKIGPYLPQKDRSGDRGCLCTLCDAVDIFSECCISWQQHHITEMDGQCPWPEEPAVWSIDRVAAWTYGSWRRWRRQPSWPVSQPTWQSPRTVPTTARGTDCSLLFC